MRIIRFVPFALLALPFALVVPACTDDATTSTPTLPDASQPAIDSGRTTTDAGGDTNVSPPVDSGVDSGVDAADAAPTTVNPFATGLDGNGTALADGQVDSHWTVKDANQVALTAYSQTNALGYSGYWLAPSATSKFISPFADTVDPTGNGTFTYKTTFSLRAGVNLGGVSLVIKSASDNSMVSISVNGIAASGVTAGSYSAFQTTTVTTGFLVGPNTVELVVGNSGGPTGMRAELELTAN